MRLFDLTLPTPAENLALDEALLDEAEAAVEPRECLRLWEHREPLVVVGRSSSAQGEVRLDQARRVGASVLRRSSGGAAVVAGPGCLMYAVVLNYQRRPALHSIDEAHRFVLERLLDALRPLAPTAQRRGTSDLAIGDRKFSGNSLRCKRSNLLYHGTLLYNFDLSLMEALLNMPTRQPSYRHGRPHEQFVANLPVDGQRLRQAIIQAWQADDRQAEWPRERVAQLVADKYSRREWHESIA